MAELLTTGQMIDRIKDGQTAISEDGERKVVFAGVIQFQNKDGFEFAYFNKEILNSMWRITPNYVSFAEAMKALSEGERITCYMESDDPLIPNYRSSYKLYEGTVFGLKEEQITRGKWSIEN